MSLHLHPPHDGHARGSDHVSEHHRGSSGESDPLVHHLKHSDWQEQALKSSHKSQGDKRGVLPDIEISDHSKYKETLSSEKATAGEKLEAARKLIHDGVRSLHFKDEHGKEHDYRIQLFKSGRVKVSEGDQVVVQDGGSASSPTGRSSGGARSFASGSDERAHNNQPFQGRRPSGLKETGGGHYRYEDPSGGREIEPAPGVDRHMWQGVKNADGSVRIGFKGCQVDTDGRGAWRHPEDRTRQAHTSLKLSDGRSLDTDKDNFFVLPPSVARAYGIHKGDLGWLVQKGTGNAVPVVFGDSGPEGKLGEASVAALKSLGYDVNGKRGVTGDNFEIVFAPGSGDGTGDIASNPHAMAAKLKQTGLVAMAAVK